MSQAFRGGRPTREIIGTAQEPLYSMNPPSDEYVKGGATRSSLLSPIFICYVSLVSYSGHEAVKYHEYTFQNRSIVAAAECAFVC
ncbi:hypothetical protein CMQ_6923 [Grosmannia clavigera kw1407]|uniref:Uncharacterized protein n=1 Tax=Grosmannia clavigera (strain kw1407 / UAMH 11150) TaxID=655863 RepID=F0X6Y9_GROCL|nr:uncharacterized protein CMQ_6923 [Grosmannia clavigera kw1407]EFX06602.1 hypothetical protein CMQ_6923 [Grosmannia clavigera kw1407]